jgi:DHA1 family tetracycline resistance protein-like MFS transporter
MSKEATVLAVDAGMILPFSLKPLMFETFVCSMAMMSFVALAGPIARTIGLEPWHMGVAMTVSGLGWMVMARIWGKASDRRGRRPVLLAGLAGYAIIYIFLAGFIDAAMRGPITPLLAFAGIVIGRGLAGIFYAAVPVTSTALVADNIQDNQRAGALAAIGAASAAGMVVGPGFAGLAAPYSLSLPLYVVAFLPLVALAILWRILPHDSPVQGAGLPAPKLNDPRLRRPMTIAFAAMFSVAVAQITVGFFALDRLHLAPGDAAAASGIALATVGVVLVLAQIILRKLSWRPERLIIAGGIIGGLGFASLVFAASSAMLWASYAVAAFGMGWMFPSVSALAANSVEPGEQGAAAGRI